MSLQTFCGKAFKQCQNLTELKARAQELQSGTIQQASRTYSVLSLENDWILTVSAVLLRRIDIYIYRERERELGRASKMHDIFAIILLAIKN